MQDGNIPYVKTYGKDSKIDNFPGKGYINFLPNRKQRRSRPERFVNNRKTFHLTVSGPNVFVRILQKVFNKRLKEWIKIYHYLPKMSKIY